MQQSHRIKFVIVSNEVVPLIQKQDGFYYDDYGTIWADFNDAYSLDKETRAGIGIFSLDGFEREVRFHDAAYSMPVYMAFNDRLTADRMLKRHMKGSWLRRPFYLLSRLFGGLFWEGPPK